MKALGSQRLKMPFLSGIIDIGTHSLRLEIFQMTKEGREILEVLDRSIDFNSDLIKRGAVSLKKISSVCEAIQEFARRLREYNIKYYRVIIASGIREAKNCDILVNRIKTTSKIDIEFISPAEEARLLFMLMRERVSEKYDFEKINTLSFAIASSALLLMVSEKGKLKLCEAVPLDLIRLPDKYGNVRIKAQKFLSILKLLNIQGKIHNRISQYILIGIGENVRAPVNINKKWNDSDFIEMTVSKLSSILRRTAKLSVQQLMEKCRINEYSAANLIFWKNIVKGLTENFKCKKVLLPPFSIYDALAADMTRKKSKLFENDIISLAEGIGEKYGCEPRHIENVTANSLKIFDKLQKKYDLNKRSRLLLQLAARLHDIGRFVDLKQYNKHSYYLIYNTILPGISENEQLILATIASCQRKRIPRGHPKYAVLTKDERIIINKLSSILLLGNMLDNLNSYNSDKLSIRLGKNSLTIRVPDCPEDLLEQININSDSNLFNETFGLEMKLCGAPGNYEI